MFIRKMRVELGKYYTSGRKGKVYRCVLSSPKGINFLDEEKNRMLFRSSCHAGYTGKPIPRGTKVFDIFIRDYRGYNLYEVIKETKN